MVDGIKLMLRDKIATNGVIHVIEGVLMPPSALSLTELLQKSQAKHMLDLLKAAHVKV